MTVKRFKELLSNLDDNDHIVGCFYTKSDVQEILETLNDDNGCDFALNDDQINEILNDFKNCDTIDSDSLQQCVIDFLKQNGTDFESIITSTLDF